LLAILSNHAIPSVNLLQNAYGLNLNMLDILGSWGLHVIFVYAG